MFTLKIEVCQPMLSGKSSLVTQGKASLTTTSAYTKMALSNIYLYGKCLPQLPLHILELIHQGGNPLVSSQQIALINSKTSRKNPFNRYLIKNNGEKQGNISKKPCLPLMYMLLLGPYQS